MFLGTYHISFTGINRIILPKKLREELGDKPELILTRGMDGCVWGFDKISWENQMARQLEVPITDQTGRAIRRYIFSGAETADLDKQGRFIIPKELLTYADIKQQIVLIGAGDHFEIWAEQSWEKILLQTEVK